MTTNTTPAVQSGGVNALQMLIMNLDSPYRLLFGALLVLIIAISATVLATEFQV